MELYLIITKSQLSVTDAEVPWPDLLWTPLGVTPPPPSLHDYCGSILSRVHWNPSASSWLPAVRVVQDVKKMKKTHPMDREQWCCSLTLKSKGEDWPSTSRCNVSLCSLSTWRWKWLCTLCSVAAVSRTRTGAHKGVTLGSTRIVEKANKMSKGAKCRK